MKFIIPALILLVLGLTGPHLYNNWRTEKEIQQKIDHSVGHLEADGLSGRNRAGHVEVDGVMRTFTHRELRNFIKKEGASPGLVYFWNWQGISRATASAMAVDGWHYFANSYLLGYQPFETDQIWVPLYTLVLRKQYEYDRLQYSGLQDVWQNSKQAFYATRGDCEDHAIILADWLISMGVDARVVLGKYKQQGHAWVIFFRKGRAYLLEATDKRKLRTAGAIPDAAVMVDYHPAYQFNRDKFWVNTGSPYTTRYDGKRWELRSRFVATEGGA